MKLTILSTNGVNKQYARHVGCDAMINLIDENLPMYTTEAEQSASLELIEQVNRLYNVINSASEIQFFQPQYNGSIPPITLNFIAWVSRRNVIKGAKGSWRDVFSEKSVHIYSYSAGTSANMVSHFSGLLEFFGAAEVNVTTTTSPVFV